MTSFQQFEANRRNALRSTGPKTEDGKRRSRVNAVRHGLTAETVIGSLEDAEYYIALEATIISDYCAETAVARELVLRLASLMWRLRRATAIETGLLEIQAEVLRESTALVFRRGERMGHIPLLFVLSIITAHSKMQESVHGLIAGTDLGRSVKLMVTPMPPLFSPAQPAN